MSEVKTFDHYQFLDCGKQLMMDIGLCWMEILESIE